MALAQTDLKVVYPQYVSSLQTDREGGYPTVNVWLEEVTDELSVFSMALLYGATYVQYKKIFIRNFGDEDALNVAIYGYNLNSNAVVSMAVERGQDQDFVCDGQEIIKNQWTVPDLYYDYTFQEILDISPLALPNIPAGESIGVWLKLTFSTIDAYNVNDTFVIGMNFEGVAGTPFNIEKSIKHSRYDSAVNIIRVSKTNAIFRGVVVEFEPLDLSASGIPVDETVYALYLDRIFFKEHCGTNRIPVQLYGMSVPITIEVFALPFGGYRPVLDALPVEDRNRLKISWLAKNPTVYDVVKHNVYWDNKTGTIINIPIAVVDANTGVGGGDKIDVSSITN